MLLCVSAWLLFEGASGWAVQMKEKYTKMRPYGEWLAENTVVLQQIIDSVPEEQRQAPPVLPAGALPSNGVMHVRTCHLPRDQTPHGCLVLNRLPSSRLPWVSGLSCLLHHQDCAAQRLEPCKLMLFQRLIHYHRYRLSWLIARCCLNKSSLWEGF